MFFSSAHVLVLTLWCESSPSVSRSSRGSRCCTVLGNEHQQLAHPSKYDNVHSMLSELGFKAETGVFFNLTSQSPGRMPSGTTALQITPPVERRLALVLLVTHPAPALLSSLTKALRRSESNGRFVPRFVLSRTTYLPCLLKLALETGG